MPRWPRSTSGAPSSTASGTTPSHQILIAQIARLSRDGPLVHHLRCRRALMLGRSPARMAESDGTVGKGVRSPCGPRSALVTTLVVLAELLSLLRRPSSFPLSPPASQV